MTLLKDVLAGLLGMFLSDARLTAAVVVVVAIAAALINLAGAAPLVAGVVVLVGCLAVLVGSVIRAARRARAERAAQAT